MATVKNTIFVQHVHEVLTVLYTSNAEPPSGNFTAFHEIWQVISNIPPIINNRI